MPNYYYECMKERDGCGQTWGPEFLPVHARHSVMCPNCMSEGEAKDFYDEERNLKLHRIEIVHRSAPNVISDITHQDGGTGDRIEMPGLGPDVTVGSRRELREAKERAREMIYNDTDGEHTTMRPFVDDNGQTVVEKVTTETEGLDIGEIHPMEGDTPPDELNQPLDPGFLPGSEGRPLRETEAKLEAAVGKPEMPEKG